MPVRSAFAVVLGLLVSSCTSAPVRIPPGSLPPPGPQPEQQQRTPLAEQGPFLPDYNLRICSFAISNPPEADQNRNLIDHKPLIEVGGIVLASVPVNDACFNSGFGPRFGRMHEGIDLKASPPSTIYSAGPGLIVEVGVASGYGNQVVIDHGGGVFTRYAHLDYAFDNISPGLIIGFGQPIGMMGNSGNATGIHLHYEVLTGDWGPLESYGLTPSDPLSWPAYLPQTGG